MSFDLNIAAPPTMTVFSLDISFFIIFLSSARAGATKVEVIASMLKAAADKSAIRLDIESLPIGLVAGGHPPAMNVSTAALP